MLVGSVDYWQIHIWKLENGRYEPASEREVAEPTFNPIIVFRSSWGGAGSLGTPLVYENQVLYFVYDDAITQEQIKERVELRGDGYDKLLEEAERTLTKHFSRDGS